MSRPSGPARPARLLRLAGHLALSAGALLWLALARRGGELCFTHAGDVDVDGRDRQMGPLVEGLRARRRPLAEVTLVSLDGGLLRTLRRTRRPFVSHAALLASARLLALAPGVDRWGGRLLVGRALLRLLAPRACYLIDESGSGQTLVRAARSLAVPTFGVQHGDFQPGNRQYADPPPGTEPADRFCVWSPWFRARLLALSPIYREAHVVVCGRLAHAPEQRARGASARGPAGPSGGARLRALLVAERGAAWQRAVEPFVAALRADGACVRVRRHPDERELPWRGAERADGTLEQELAGADVALGVGSSALLEALWAWRPAIHLAAPGLGDPAGYAAQGLVPSCASPAGLPELSRRLARLGPEPLREARERVWGGAPADPVGALLERSVSVALQPGARVRRKATRSPLP